MDLLSTSRLFEDFLAQRHYLKNVTSSTIEWYETAFKALQRTHGVDPVLSKATLQDFVVSLRKRKRETDFVQHLHQGAECILPLGA